MLKLGVNIDHVATLREARYRNRSIGEPDPVALALECESAGAHGITAHLREDRRHIQDKDIARLRSEIQTRLNLEMGNTPEILAIALQTKPDIVCLVPEKRQEVTTEGGLDAASQVEELKATCSQLNDAGIEVSLFIDPDLRQVEASSRIGSQFVELHTGAFAEAFQAGKSTADEVKVLVEAAQSAQEAGLGVNAGHGIHYDNLHLLHEVPHLVELNIGHSIVSRSVSIGMAGAVREMLDLMKQYPD